MGYSRRELMRYASAVGAGLVLSGTAASAGDCDTGSVTGTQLNSDGPRPPYFAVPLPQPPVLRPASVDGTTDYYEVTARAGSARMLPGTRTTIWGYDGLFPGPTIVSRSGRRTVVRHINELPVPTTPHLHGGHTPADSDGYPTDAIVRTGGSLPDLGRYVGMTMSPSDYQVSYEYRDYVYPLNQRAATLWYHDHRMGFTGPQVYRGLAGFHLVYDDEETRLPLPGGDKDQLLMIVDRAFDGDGQLKYPSTGPSLQHEAGVSSRYHDGVLGDTILVNGVPWPFLEVSNTRYRFRILNASNARRFELALDPPPADGPHFIQVGSDGGLLDRPVGHDLVPIAQAERFDVVIDFGQYRVGDRVTLINRAGSGPTTVVMQFRVVREEADDSWVPGVLADMSEFDALTPDRASGTRAMRFSGGDPWEINNKPFDLHRVDANPKLGATEIWKISTSAHHPVHLHLVQFKIIARTGGLRPTDGGWKDTFDLAPGEDGQVLARFTEYPGVYVFHCHNLEHEDMAMMANVAVE
ncbi:multicopper oxidase family protein [Rugosimonospora africana]|uniref:Multicopper oxidase CueO n=1 Tax=Rugosimonospora africana TaxID=556532 RepID=A0A8J3R1X8_9ACTN|nr:multicopper oxidase family protein [Rugosimonospora africana]GIH20042.1 spore coat protein A [Rugosimonospora africana]